MQTKSDVEKIYEMMFGYRLTQSLYVATKLRIADLLVDGPLSVAELACSVKAHKGALHRVLKCLSAHGVFKESVEGFFDLTPLAELLISTNAYNVSHSVIMCGEEFYQSMGDLLYSTESGEPAFDHRYKRNFWQHMEQRPELAKTFSCAMERGSLNSVHALLEAYDFSSIHKIIDIGGGKGHFLAAILRQYAEICGVIFDLPCVIGQAKEYVKESNVESRCEFVEGDFFVDSLPKGDALILKVILHDWGNVEALQILKQCHRQLDVSGKLLIIEKVIQGDSHLKNILLGDIHMLVTHGGMERTLLEYEELLKQGGFKLSKVITTRSAFSIIEAMPI